MFIYIPNMAMNRPTGLPFVSFFFWGGLVRHFAVLALVALACTRCKWGCVVEPVQGSSVAPIKPAGQKRKWKCHANVFVML